MNTLERGAEHPPTGPIYLLALRAALESELSSMETEDDETYVLVPDLTEPGQFVAQFSDGSFTRWLPDDAVLVETV